MSDPGPFVADIDSHFHVADPDDVAGMIAFLATDAANLITGHVIVLR